MIEATQLIKAIGHGVGKPLGLISIMFCFTIFSLPLSKSLNQFSPQITTIFFLKFF
jgi:hypothetical protein